MNELKMIDFSRKVVLKKTAHQELEDGTFKEVDYWGTYETELTDAFGGDSIITFDSSHKAVASIASSKKSLDDTEREIGLLGAEIQLIIQRMGLIQEAVEHAKVSQELLELMRKKSGLEAEKTGHELSFIEKTFRNLSLKISNGDDTINADNFDKVDSAALTTLVVVVSNFLSQRGRIIPLKK